MIKALDEDFNGVLGWNARRGPSYCCPSCLEPVVLKAGEIVVHHFAHRPNSGCVFGVGESLRHAQMKYQVGQVFSRYRPDYELQLVLGRRADVVINQVVVECQHSVISIYEWAERTRDYNRAGYPVLWVWDLIRITKKKIGNGTFGHLEAWIQAEPPGDYWRRSRSEFWIPAEIRHCHQHSYGHLYVMDAAGEIRACYLKTAAERETASGPWGGGYYYRPKAIRRPCFMVPPMKGSEGRGVDGERLIRLGEGVWWKDG